MSADPLEVDVSEAEEPGYVIAVVDASDSDQGINAEIIYSLKPGRDIDEGLVHINSSTGRIVLSRRLGRLYVGVSSLQSMHYG